MEKIILIEQTKYTPLIIVEKGCIKLEGTFIPENQNFFKEVLEDIKKLKEIQEINFIHVNIPYINPCTSKFLYDLFNQFVKSNIKINWCYFDEEILRIGKEYEEIFFSKQNSNLTFKFIKVEEKI
jgi:hypothetical protein